MKCADPLFTSKLIKPLHIGDSNSDSNSVELVFSKRFI